MPYTWDARGNLIHDGVYTYTYNAAGRMVRAESVTTTVVYTYNADGLRVAQAVDGDVSTFVWDWATGVPEMLSDGDSLYLIGHDTLGWYDGDDWTYVLPDALGSVRQQANIAGTVINTREWTPFGVEVGDRQTGLGYTGEWQAAYTDLAYLRARWYLPQTGRFTRRDEWLGNYRHPRTQNGYLYAEANPMQYVDPSGFEPEDRFDPFDPGWCDESEGWSYPAKLRCQLITGKYTPNDLRNVYMYDIYLQIIAGMELASPITGGRYSFNHAPDFWRHFLFGSSNLGAGDVELKGDEWGAWAWTHDHHKEMHDMQIMHFLQSEVLIAQLMNLPQVGPWHAGRLPDDAVGKFLIRPGGADYKFVEAGSASNDVTVAIGRHFIEGNFYADNLSCNGASVSMDITIDRFINDRFDFVGDNGSVPLPVIIDSTGQISNVLSLAGYGHVPHAWAQRLVDEGWAHEFNIDIEWVEKYSLEVGPRKIQIEKQW